MFGAAVGDGASSDLVRLGDWRRVTDEGASLDPMDEMSVAAGSGAAVREVATECQGNYCSLAIDDCESKLSKVCFNNGVDQVVVQRRFKKVALEIVGIKKKQCKGNKILGSAQNLLKRRFLSFCHPGNICMQLKSAIRPKFLQWRKLEAKKEVATECQGNYCSLAIDDCESKLSKVCFNNGVDQVVVQRRFKKVALEIVGIKKKQCKGNKILGSAQNLLKRRFLSFCHPGNICMQLKSAIRPKFLQWRKLEAKKEVATECQGNYCSLAIDDCESKLSKVCFNNGVDQVVVQRRFKKVALEIVGIKKKQCKGNKILGSAQNLLKRRFLSFCHPGNICMQLKSAIRPKFLQWRKLEAKKSGDKFLWQPPLTRPTNSDATRQDEVLRTVSRKNNDGEGHIRTGRRQRL
ncbi:hypothetical protein E3N88_35614 [Mikania micrantha]|uniref:Uncharacterized protein n=1 Tax=Mikania micrantha TaxID=192012 RepID=A0A5N6M1E7_9ASTR|nr:hypothetical protein E3N88_35614 [Mikania micrantha]